MNERTRPPRISSAVVKANPPKEELVPRRDLTGDGRAGSWALWSTFAFEGTSVTAHAFICADMGKVPLRVEGRRQRVPVCALSVGFVATLSFIR
ncbi:Hypothetical protein SMAX5B_002637 [Scophthalmus maximus]|uniref:Uncharacterized protein n=1 Tax=Scophthalmus maximus TaxID=52904 RepID=A0A2U9BZT2_SCOMX|nr:Hypothetical protein SMAX5B_002637 [Scophthalmus maximus]